MSMYLARIVPVDQAHTAMPAPISPRDRSFALAASVVAVSAGLVVTPRNVAPQPVCGAILGRWQRIPSPASISIRPTCS